MELSKDHSELAQLIADAIRGDVEVIDEVYRFTFSGMARVSETPGRQTLEAVLEASQLNKLVELLRGKEKRDETTLYDSNCYEILVREQSPFYGPSIFRRDHEIVEADMINNIVYRLSPASDEYILFLLHEISNVADVRRNWGFMPRIRSDENQLGVFDLLRQASPRLLTLRLISDKEKSIQSYIKHSNAFLFEISYNLDIALVQQRYLDELIRSARIAKVRRSTVEDIDVPRRFYEQDLVYHYQMGVATDSPPLEYLSYYHVAEHFFESIFIEDLIERVQGKITHAGFSYKKKSDVRDLIKYITNRTQLRDSTLVYNELEALKLTINKYVDLDELRQKVNDYDSSLVAYYRENPVTFSGGDLVDLDGNDPASIVSHLAKRIYKTRNSVVHSKASESDRYIPFRDDRTLVKEVPLLRFLAEAIIETTAQPIG